MKDSAVKIAVMLFVVAVLTLGNMLAGCAVSVRSSARERQVKALKLPTGSSKPNLRCRTLGKDVNSRVAVLVQKNCVRNGATTVGVVVLDGSQKGRLAAKDAGVMVRRILGFNPSLSTVMVGKERGKVFMVLLVTGVVDTTVAYRGK